MVTLFPSEFSQFNPVHVLIVSFLVYHLINYLTYSVKRLIKLPPGPWGLPIVGYLPFLRQDAHLQLTEMTFKYGPILSLKVGQYDLVVINSWELIKEAFGNEVLLDRPPQTFIPSVIKDSSFAEMSGQPWRDHRRLTITTLRNVGMGKLSMEKMIQEEISIFIKKINDSYGEPFNFGHWIAFSVSNNISILLFGHRDDYDNPIKVEIENSLAQLNRLGRFFSAAVFLPWLAEIAVTLGHASLRTMRRLTDLIEDNVEREIDQHKKRDGSSSSSPSTTTTTTTTTKPKVKDYIDGYLAEMKNRDNSVFTMTALRRNTSLFYTAGSDTTQIALNWIMLHLARYPSYQQRIRDEIMATIGSDRLPESDDRQFMPYTLAFIYEVFRMTTIAPISPYRQVRKDVTIGNHLIPKDSLVVFNLWAVHYDPNLWDNPDTFNPDRFLDQQTSKVIKPPYLITFSGGKRNCPGESFAILQLFLYTVSIVQKFTILPKPGSIISLKGNYTFTYRPKDDVTLIFQPINHSN